MRKNLITKLAVLLICLPAVSQAAYRPGSGSAAKNITAKSKSVDYEAALANAGILDVKADNLFLAVHTHKRLDPTQLKDLINAADTKETKDLASAALKMISAEAVVTLKDDDRGSLGKVNGVRDKALQLSIEAATGSSHSKDSLGKILNTLTEGYRGDSVKSEDLASDLTKTLEATASKEALEKAKEGNEDILDMFGGCSKI